MYATVFPKRINVTADDITSTPNGGGFYTYTNQVMTALKNDPDTQNFDFSQVDRRAGYPGFQFDNSVLSADNAVDYAIIVWRNSNAAPYNLFVPPYGGGGGWAGVPYTTGIPSANGQTYTIGNGFTHTLGMEGVSPPLFVHEFAHTFYSCPHYFGANGVAGHYFNATEGPGMMSYFRTFFAANSWERWFNGWAELTASGDDTDIRDASSLAATGGVYTLHDYITTGDMMRIKLPHSNQYLWLENHAGLSVFDQRISDIIDTQPQPVPFATPPRGLVAMLEDASSSRNQPLYYGADQGVNGLKMLSAQGNFDYGHSAGTSDYNNHFYGIQLYNFTNPIANPFGAESQISRHRFDANGDGEITINTSQGNSGGARNEMQFSMVKDGTLEDGLFGPNIGSNAVGYKMGISYNPAIFEHQHYDEDAHQLSTIELNGLSVEIIGRGKGRNPSLTIRVRYDDVDVVQDTRWTGDLTMTDVVPGPGADVHVTGAALTIDKSGTANRHTPTAAGDFINPTYLLCPAGTTFTQDAGPQNTGSSVLVRGTNTTMQVLGTVQLLGSKNEFVVQNGALLELSRGSTYEIAAGSKLVIAPGGSLVIHYGVNIRGAGRIEVQAGGYLCSENGVNWQVDPSFTLDVDRNAWLGVNYDLDPVPTATCNPTLQNYCAVLTGGNPYIHRTCGPPSTSEARSQPSLAIASVTPNPADDQATVVLTLAQAGEVRLSVQDMQGTTRLPAQAHPLAAGSQALRLPLRELPAGVYLLVAESPDGRQVTRLQVTH